ncbi:tetratricopeptide repeat protein [Desulfatibacillum aliphaticivorans]|uniref:tetratricopeptide repeat protein n=1 Tax=Desulfatibacillum aliphaticivorans TaxID=218208 RepID=UPI001470BC92|nr:hypothetical protein [Desulfatibacillum aliphaticivorans]
MTLFRHMTIKYWSVRSLAFTVLGIASGVVLSCVTGAYSPLPTTLLAGLAGFLLFQGQALHLFFGAQRGYFEYMLLMKGVESRTGRLIRQSLGMRFYIRSQIVGLKEEHLSAVIKEGKNRLEWTDLMCLLIKASSIARRNGEKGKEISILKTALSLYPYSVVVNNMLADCYESQGMVEEALECYRLGKMDRLVITPALKEILNRKMDQLRRQTKIV